jgi:hypothetical protein
VLQPIRYLLDRPLCFRPERKLAGSDFHRRIDCALQGTPNNLAERILRHWVIHRRITYGTRTEAGTRALGIIASVIDTCRLRHINPWPFLADALRARRNGAQSLTMPLAAA